VNFHSYSITHGECNTLHNIKLQAATIITRLLATESKVQKISPGSVATYLRCGGIVNDSFITYLHLNRPLSAEAVLKFNPIRIPDVTKVTKTSVRSDENSLQDSSDRKVYCSVSWRKNFENSQRMP